MLKHFRRFVKGIIDFRTKNPILSPKTSAQANKRLLAYNKILKNKSVTNITNT